MEAPGAYKGSIHRQEINGITHVTSLPGHPDVKKTCHMILQRVPFGIGLSMMCQKAEDLSMYVAMQVSLIR